MAENLKFFKVSSIVLKVGAFIILLLGAIGGISLLAQNIPDIPRWYGIIVLIIYAFLFFVIFVVAKIADLLFKRLGE